MRSSSRLVSVPAVAAVLAFTAAACERPEAEDPEAEVSAEPAAGVVEFTALEYAFEAPAEIPSGWVRYRLNNERAEEIHEVTLGVLPEGRSHAEYVEDVLPVWAELGERVREGELEGAEEAYGAAAELLPEWALGIEYRTARGLVSPGRSTSTTAYLEPGEYVLDCWVKSPDGDIHVAVGMSRGLTVTEEDSGLSAPEPDLDLTLSAGGIVTDGELAAGDQSIAVHLEEDPVHDNVHLIRLEDDTDLAEVAAWLDWYEEGGLQAPAPADFLGGVHAYGAMPADGVLHFSVENVEPGDYAWIVEAPPEDAVWETFTVD